MAVDEKLKNRQCTRTWLRLFFALLLTVSMFAQTCVPDAGAAEETTLRVYKGQSEDAVPFNVTNMFPGDSVENRYNVQISFVGNLTLHFRANVRTGYEKLAEVLKCRIEIEDKLLYEGLLRDMPASVDHPVSSNTKTTQNVPYDIAVWLDTSVGNEYMNKELICDFCWWVDVPDQPADPDRPNKDDGHLTSPPKTGDQIMYWVLILCASGAALVVLWMYKRKEETYHEGA